MNETLAECSKGRNNNLNLIRFTAACLVIISHAYPLTSTGQTEDFCSFITNGTLTLGGVAVSIFFFYGGFLIMKSLDRIQLAFPYFKARILRIIPPLAFVTFMLTFVFGPLLTTKDFLSYMTDGRTYKYLLNSVLILVHHLPGVFENNFYGAAVNGPLWTLPVEFLCYILCFVFYKLGFVKKVKWTILPVFAIYFCADFFFMNHSSLLRAALRPMMLFYMGMLAYIYRDKIRPGFQGFVVGTCILIFGMFLNHILPIYDFFIIIAFPLILLYLGFGCTHKFASFGTKCECSYGMYLCAFPIQQSLVCFFPEMTPLMNMIASIPLSVAGGIVIYYLIEKPIQNKLRKSNHSKSRN